MFILTKFLVTCKIYKIFIYIFNTYKIFKIVDTYKLLNYLQTLQNIYIYFYYLQNLQNNYFYTRPKKTTILKKTF